MIRAFTFALAIMSWTAAAHAYRSTVIERLDLSLSDTKSGFHLRATAPLAFVSSDGTALSAANVTLELHPAHREPERYTCNSFRYDLRSDFLICDSHEIAGGASFVLDGLTRKSTHL